MASSTSTGHIRKRQYQPSIHSYLNRNANSPTSSHLERTTSPLSPPLPAETQASLLSVGMRVRKSVPEGYKTHKTLGTPGFPFPSTAPITSKASKQQSYHLPSARELTPFCGLHKTGGWAAQDVPSSSAPAVMCTDGEDSDEDNLPGLTMSQGTIPSTQSSFASSSRSNISGLSRKRTYEEEIEDDLDAYFEESESVEPAVDNAVRSARPFAQMKPPLRKSARDGRMSVVGADDFDDASFLVPPEGMDVE